MKVILYTVSIMLVIWMASETFVSRVRTAYWRGYQDGIRAYKTNPTDGQCASWLMQTNMKDAKKRICK